VDCSLILAREHSLVTVIFAVASYLDNLSESVGIIFCCFKRGRKKLGERELSIKLKKTGEKKYWESGFAGLEERKSVTKSHKVDKQKNETKSK
jgi:hypothetical protein